MGVQVAGCAPFVEAIRQGRTAPEALAARWPDIQTVAGAIADDVVFDGHMALPAVRESGGTAVAVTDEETLAAEASLARLEGLFVEPAAATTVAALKEATGRGPDPAGRAGGLPADRQRVERPGSARRLVDPVELVPFDRAAFATRCRG